MLACSALGDDAHYQRYPLGARAGGMGGIAVAGGFGADACYYNPAGLALSEHDGLSLSGNLYGVQRYKIKAGLSAGDDLDSKSFVTIPASLGDIRRLSDRLVLAFSAYQPNRFSTGELTSRGNGGRIYSYSTEEQSIWVGPSLGCQATPSLSLGLSLYGVYASNKATEDTYSTAHHSLEAYHIQYSSSSLLAIFGLQWSLPRDWRIGLAVQTQTIPLADSGKLSLATVDPDFPFSLYTDHLDARNELPWKIAVGIARQVPRNYAYGLDVSYHTAHSHRAIDIDFEGLGRTSMWIRRHEVVDFNLGGEYYIAGRYPVRAGFYTSFSATDAREDSDSMANSDIDLYGLTFSVGRETERAAVNIGLNFMYGSGDDLGYSSGNDSGIGLRKSDASTSHAFVTFSTSYYF